MGRRHVGSLASCPVWAVDCSPRRGAFVCLFPPAAFPVAAEAALTYHSRAAITRSTRDTVPKGARGQPLGVCEICPRECASDAERFFERALTPNW